MRTLVILICGIILWGGCLGVTRLFGAADLGKMSIATYVFIALWFLVSAGNMWVGVAKAGYSIKEELPIFLLIFSLPVAVALFVQWKFL
jgi:hypothetical protein